MQRRLGTADELPNDLAQILVLAHAINNTVTGEYLRASLESLDSPISLLAFTRQALRPASSIEAASGEGPS